MQADKHFMLIKNQRVEANTKLSEKAKLRRSKSKADNTLKAYRADWRDFAAWCAYHGERDLPAALQEIMLQMQVGQVTPPFGSTEDGVRALVLCGRDDPQQAGAPSFDNILAQMEEERVNRRALRYLRDLRRDAVVDYR